MVLKIGLTGGIGSGKSTVAAIFEVLGIPVYYADAAAKRLMNENSQVKALMVEHFGTETYAEGVLNKTYLSEKVFSNPTQLALLNQLIHPITIADANDWMTRQESPYCIKEAALIFESHAEAHLDYIVGVQAPLETRIARVMKRDEVSRKKVLTIMERQLNEEEKMKRCDMILVNDDETLLIPQVIALHEKLLSLVRH